MTNKEDDDTTFNRLYELQILLKKESALKELFNKTFKEIEKNIDTECNNIYKKKMEVLNILQKINHKNPINSSDNNSKNKEQKKSLKEYILIENNYDYLQVLKTYIPNLLNNLWENPKLVANLLMNADKEDIKNYLAPFFCNNFYENILSSYYIEDPLMFLIYILLEKEINNISNIEDSDAFLNDTPCSYLFSQLIDKKDVKDFFKIILGNIIENLDNNQFNFNIKTIIKNQVYKKNKTVDESVFVKDYVKKSGNKNNDVNKSEVSKSNVKKPKISEIDESEIKKKKQ
jgi:hypothetical protein